MNALDVPKSSYLYWLSSGSLHLKNRLAFFHQIIEVYFDSKGIYGAPKITAILNSRNIPCSISKVSRAMVLIGIKSVVSKRFPKKISRISPQEYSLIINYIKDLSITQINQVWTTDITYIQTILEGTFFLITFIDYFSKKVIAWGLFSDQKTDKILLVLQKAILTRSPSPGLIIHSDKGSQMRSKAYRSFLSKHHFIFSYTSLNHSCDENAAQESFHASLKKEILYQHKIYNYEQAFRTIFDYIEGFYNPIRIHSSIGYLSPINFEIKLSSFKNPL